MKRAKKKIRQQVTQELVQALDSKFFKVFSEPARVELLKILMVQGRSDISGISKHLPQDRSVISRHLRMMLDTEILIREKEGRCRYYQVNGKFLLFTMESLVDNFRDSIAACCP